MPFGGRQRGAGSDERGQSEPIGVVLLLGITILGSIAVVGFGAASLDSARSSSQLESTGHAMTQFDSQVAVVALGDSDVQRFSLGQSGRGSYSVRPNEGWINITHLNRTGSGDTETILNQTMGSIVYERDDRTVAYQGGGVWLEHDGSSIMVSPPEFHYRSATLTLPLIRIRGSDNAAGRVTGRIVHERRSRRVFPNASTTYDGSSQPYQNPIEDGKVTITVHSDYYQAWAEYFRTRSTGEVTVFDNNQTVELLLLTKGTLGDFDMPADGNAIEIRGLGQAHGITDFNITIIDDDQDSADFSNLKWSFTVNDNGKRLELHLRSNGNPCSGGGDYAQFHIYYANQSGGYYHGWSNNSAFKFDCESVTGNDYNDDGDTDDVRLVANFTSTTELEYNSNPTLWEYSTGGTFVNPVIFDDADHGGSIAWEPATYSAGNEVSVNRIINHYFSLLGPNFDLVVTDFPGNAVNEDESYGRLEQAGTGGNFLTFLHVTENEIRIEFD